MEEIQDIILNIVRGCQQGGLVVPNVLAAFIARTIVEKNDTVFALDKKMTPDKMEEVILMSIERLLERDSPSLECMKMQVEYDSAFLKNDMEATKTIRIRNKMITSHKVAIAEVEMEDSNDFEALTLLYRKIFRYLLEFSPNSKMNDRAVEREVAAALESVFPRIGLKAFVQLTFEEKNTQLTELARIILGIRLFNRDQGRGGAGIDKMDTDATKLSQNMVADLTKEVLFFSDACEKYQIAILKAQLQRKRRENKIKSDLKVKRDEKKEDEGSLKTLHTSIVSQEPTNDEYETADLPIVNDYLILRWTEELNNRRQYLYFLIVLKEDIQGKYYLI